MEVHPGVFTSSTDAEDWEPFEEVPGSEFHAVIETDRYQTGMWRIPGEGTMSFRWSAPMRDTFVVLEGEVRVEIHDGPTLHLRPGSIASMPPGLEATWHVTLPYKDVYVFA